MKLKPMKSVVLPERATAPEPDTSLSDLDAPNNESVTRSGPSWPEGTLLVNRSGRVIPGDSGWMFAFENLGKNPKNPPIRLLSNRLLETAVAMSAGGKKGIVLTISGEVTVYKGFNYLLLRKVLFRHNLGNFQ
jgi:hypothetical protein